MANFKGKAAAFLGGMQPYMDMILKMRMDQAERREKLIEEMQKKRQGDVESGAAVETPYRPQSIADTRAGRDPLSLLPGFNVAPPTGQPLPGPRRGGFPAGLPTSIPSRTAIPASMSGEFMTSQQEPGAFRQDKKEYAYPPKLTEEQIRAREREGYTQTTKYGPTGLSEGWSESKDKEPAPTYLVDPSGRIGEKVLGKVSRQQPARPSNLEKESGVSAVLKDKIYKDSKEEARIQVLEMQDAIAKYNSGRSFKWLWEEETPRKEPLSAEEAANMQDRLFDKIYDERLAEVAKVTERSEPRKSAGNERERAIIGAMRIKGWTRQQAETAVDQAGVR